MSAEIQEIQVAARVHGRTLLRPAEDGTAGSGLLIGFHGYGENAQRHLDALVGVPGASAFHIASVQALHPFYNTRTGEVVASWMTKQDRELAIADNIAYVAATVADLKAQLSVGDDRLIWAGFSQGVAMAYRAAAGSGHAARGLVALCGDVPPELAGRDLGAMPPVLIGCGETDEWYNREKLTRDLELLETGGAQVEACVFDGGHEWTGQFYRACGRFLERVLV